MTKKRLYLSMLFVIVIALVFWFFKDYTSAPDGQTKPADQSKIDETTKANDTEENDFDKQQFSTSSPSSLWVIANKQNPLQPKNYAPADLATPNVPLRVPGNDTMQLRKAAAATLESLFAGAKRAGYDLMLSSGYRSYDYQINLYGSYVKSSGTAAADKYSARPGYSEHQTGLAADVEATSRKCEISQCFGDMPEGKWLAANAYKFGFIIRYPKDKAKTTGYEYEPWHVRYVGLGLANEMHSSGSQTLEKFFGVAGGDSFKS